MFKKIFITILLISITIITILFSIYTFFSYQKLEIQTWQQLNDNLKIVTNIINQDNNYQQIINNFPYRITIINQSGTVIFDNQYNPIKLDSHANRTEFIQATKNQIGKSIRHSQTNNTSLYYVATKIKNNHYLRIGIEQNTLLSIIFNNFALYIFINILTIIICAIIAFYQAKKIVIPINNLNLKNPNANNIYPELQPLIQEIINHNNYHKSFSQNVSHELKTPLTSIIGFSELISLDLVNKNDIKHIAQKIHNESKNLLQKIEQLLILSSIDQSQQIQLTNNYIDEIIIKIITNLKEAIKLKNIQIVTELNHFLSLINSTLIYIAIYNIIENAIKYSKDNTTIHISIKKETKQTTIIIADNGIGIDKSELALINQRFYRSPKHSNIQGSGLGIPIAKQIIEKHNGNLNIESTLYQGTTVIIMLPNENQNNDH